MDSLDPPVDCLDLTSYWTWMGKDGICRTKTKPQAEVTLEEAIKNSVAVNSFYTNKKFPLLIDSRNIKSMTREARQYFSTNGRKTNVRAFGIIIKSPLSRVIGNFFMGLNKPAVPAKLFDDERKAIEWLKEYL